MKELEPITLGKNIDLSFRNTFKKFKQVIIVTLIYMAAAVASFIPVGIAIYMNFFELESLFSYGDFDQFDSILGIFSTIPTGIIFSWIITILLISISSLVWTATLYTLKSKLYLEMDITITDALSIVKEKLFKLIGVGIIISLIMGVLMTPAFLMMFNLFSSSFDNFRYGLIGGLFSVFFLTWIAIGVISIFFAFAYIATISEEHTSFSAISRSFNLVKMDFFKVLGNLFVAGLIMYGISMISSIPNSIIQQLVLRDLMPFYSGTGDVLRIGTIVIGGLVYILISMTVSMISNSFYFSFISILFYDFKVRYEGWGIEKMVNDTTNGSH